MTKRKTAGELSLAASADTTRYNSLEVAHALADEVEKELFICARRHNTIFDEEEFCIGYVIATDPMIQNVMRRKFFAMLYMPSPRPNQSVFLYNKMQDQITKCLWVLPNPATMAELSELTIVDKKYRRMKAWCDAFYEKRFWPFIRSENKISLLSEIEYLNANREKLIKAGCKEGKPPSSEAFDFSKIAGNKVVNPIKPISD